MLSDLRSLSSVRFSDGTVWSAKEVESRVDRRILGTDGDDVLNGLPWDDIIVGGKGNDVLRGGAGRDTYEWSPGDGNDVIEEHGTGNVLKFGEGVEAKDVHLRRSEDDLVVTHRGTGETLTLKFCSVRRVLRGRLALRAGTLLFFHGAKRWPRGRSAEPRRVARAANGS